MGKPYAVMVENRCTGYTEEYYIDAPSKAVAVALIKEHIGERSKCTVFDISDPLECVNTSAPLDLLPMTTDSSTPHFMGIRTSVRGSRGFNAPEEPNKKKRNKKMEVQKPKVIEEPVPEAVPETIHIAPTVRKRKAPIDMTPTTLMEEKPIKQKRKYVRKIPLDQIKRRPKNRLKGEEPRVEETTPKKESKYKLDIPVIVLKET
jgi:hypothetical protein